MTLIYITKKLRHRHAVYKLTEGDTDVIASFYIYATCFSRHDLRNCCCDGHEQSVTHPSTNRARRRATSLMRPITRPRQAATPHFKRTAVTNVSKILYCRATYLHFTWCYCFAYFFLFSFTLKSFCIPTFVLQTSAHS